MKSFLQQLTGQPINTVSYPDGAYNTSIIDIANDDSDKGALMENQEQFTIYVKLDTPNYIDRNKDFSIEIRPEQGAAYSIKRNAPARIYKMNVLY